MSDTEAWGQLVSLTDIESEPIPLIGDKIVIGRATDSDVCLSENKLVSGYHFFIQRNTDGVVTLHDSSTNGTLLNLTYKISKGKSKQMSHGDEFYIVYKKNNEENNVGYIYQDTEELHREEGTQEYSPPDLLDATLEDSDCNYISPVKLPEKKRKSEENEGEDEKPYKKLKSENETNSTSGTQSKNCAGIKSESDQKRVSDSNTENPASGKNEIRRHNEISDSDSKKADKEKDKAVEEIGEKLGTCSKVCKGDDVVKGEINNEVKSETKGKTEPLGRDDIEENLQCMICQEMMYDCISLQPCLHSFCAGCYSDWMARSQECPSCRKKVERINKNHIVNNLIEAYLKEHPEKRRPEEDIKELNEKNKITNDMLYPKEQLQHSESSEYSDTDNDDNDDDDDTSDVSITPAPYIPPVFRPPNAMLLPPPAPRLYGFGTPVFGVTSAYKTVCRQCPEYKDPANNNNNNNTGIISGIVNTLTTIKNTVTGATAGCASDGASDQEPGTSGEGKHETAGHDKAEPSTSGVSETPVKPKEDPKVMPDPPPYVCVAIQNHVLCQCCLQPMPDRRIDGTSPPQQCTICYRAYCHAYWGCRKADCLGCLNAFREMNFGRKSLNGIILDNQYESEIFRDYIDSRGMSVKDILKECCKGIDAGQFSVAAQGTHNFKTERPVCYACGLNIFKQAVFQYRKTIKKEEFPEAVQNRPDCYWGSKCRTQKNKPHHARNFNHVCDQTRQF